MAGPTCTPAKPWGALLNSGAVAVTAARKAYGSTVGRVLAKVAAAQPDGTLGKALCGFGPYPTEIAEPAPELRSFTVRVWNENEELDDAHQITITGPDDFSETFDWDGSALNDTTYGPFTGSVGAYTITGVMTEDHGNGNFFIVEITAADPSETISTASVGTAGFNFDFTLPPTP